MNSITQVGLVFTGVVAIYLSQSTEVKYRKFASVFGLLGQPFWFLTAYQAGSMGMALICCLYTFSWFKGFRAYWLVKQEKGAADA